MHYLLLEFLILLKKATADSEKRGLSQKASLFRLSLSHIHAIFSAFILEII
jgi:hypothetical protein